MQLATLTQCAISMMSLYFGERNFAVYKPPHHLSLVGTTLKRLRRYCTATIHRTSSTSPSKPVCGLVLPNDPMNLLLRYRHQFIVNWFRSPFIICLFNFIAKYNLFQKPILVYQFSQLNSRIAQSPDSWRLHWRAQSSIFAWNPVKLCQCRLHWRAQSSNLA